MKHYIQGRPPPPERWSYISESTWLEIHFFPLIIPQKVFFAKTSGGGGSGVINISHLIPI